MGWLLVVGYWGWEGSRELTRNDANGRGLGGVGQLLLKVPEGRAMLAGWLQPPDVVLNDSRRVSDETAWGKCFAGAVGAAGGGTGSTVASATGTLVEISGG